MPDTEVLHLFGMTDIEVVIMAPQLHWAEHVARMTSDRIPLFQTAF